MFGLFKSKREKWKDKINKTFDVYIAGLKGMDDNEISFLLDQAIHIKDSSLMMKSDDDPEKLFWEDPLTLDESVCIERLQFWYTWMLGWASEGAAGNSKNASFQIYFLSLGGLTFVELRYRAKEMWKELSRGFKTCSGFDPQKDIPKGLEKFK